MNLTVLSDAQLLDGLQALCGQGRVVLARLLAHIGEVEDRRLHLEAACPSMFQFCVQRLGMSEDEACRRIHAARLARRFPDLLARIERGDLTLTTIALLHDALTEANYQELVDTAVGKTKAEVQALLVKRSPRPDVPAAITTIPMQPVIPTVNAAPVEAPAVPAGSQLLPLSDTRHHVQFTASDDLRKKLEHAQDLLRHVNARGDLAVVVERAVDLLLEKLEKQRLGKASRPKRSAGDSDTATVSRATRRAVFERDGERCTFTDADGHRCAATTWLELDHVVPRAVGGPSEPGNLRVRCRAHNRHYAEQTFGKEHVERKIRERRDPRQRSCRCPARTRRRERVPPDRGADHDPRPGRPPRGAGNPRVAAFQRLNALSFFGPARAGSAQRKAAARVNPLRLGWERLSHRPRPCSRQPGTG